MPGGNDAPAVHLRQAAQTLARIAAGAQGSGIRLLVETHDAFLRGGDLRRLLETAQAGPAVGAIWDALHPWRAGEDPASTAAALGPWLGELQIKDVAAPTRRRPLVPGTGAVPLPRILAEARATGFTGPVVLEHEARWYPDAAPIEEAIAGAQQVLADARR
jgi:sugar phosphate isomerase/epimerase